MFVFPSRRRHTRSLRDWSSDVCSSDLRAAQRRAAKRSGLFLRDSIGHQGKRPDRSAGDRKSTRLNSSHVEISYAVFCLKKKKKKSRKIKIKKEKKKTTNE